MIKIYRYLLLLVAAALLCVQPSFAQSNLHMQSPSLQSLEELKRHIVQLMKENNELEVQYALIKREYDAMNAEYRKHASKLDQLRREREQETRLINRRHSRLKKMEADLPDSEANKLILEGRIAFANQKLLDADEQLRMLKLKIADLEFQKRDIQLAEKAKSYSRKELEQKQRKKLQELKDIYAKNVELEKELLADISRIKQEGRSIDTQMDEISENIEDMGMRIKYAEAEIAMRKKENAILRNKKLYQVRLSENKTWQYDQKRLALKEAVDKLASKAEHLDEKIELSRGQQIERREILDTIMRIDRENQSLKDKIIELQQEIKKSGK